MIMVQKEQEYKVDPFFMTGQPFITPKMRAILIDYLSEVAAEFMLTRASFFIAVYIVDSVL